MKDRLPGLGGEQGVDLLPWRVAEGVEVPGDELRFLLIPDQVEQAMVFDLARQVHDYQRLKAGSGEEITKAVMVTMGGLLPGVLLADHLMWLGNNGIAPIEFGTLGVSLYAAPGQKLEKPRVVQDVSISVEGQVVLGVEDLGDSGGTMNFVEEWLLSKGAAKVLKWELYVKPEALRGRRVPNFWFGQVPQDTWIIMPRERVETLMKRVPVWKERGADKGRVNASC